MLQPPSHVPGAHAPQETTLQGEARAPQLESGPGSQLEKARTQH